MAIVTGVTLQKMQEIQSNTVVSARVEKGVLYFKKGDGVTEFNVGSIVLSPIEAWPVGSIFMTVDSRNPKTLLGVPSDSPVTWVRWGQGRMPVSLDSGNERFNSVEETGGAERVQLSIAEMPSHNHAHWQTGTTADGYGRTGYQSHDHSHTGYTSTDGNHQHGYTAQATAAQTASGNSNYYTSRGPGATDWAGSHSHTVQTYGVSSNHYHDIPPQGGNASHENMPPYISVYMWKRTV